MQHKSSIKRKDSTEVESTTQAAEKPEAPTSESSWPGLILSLLLPIKRIWPVLITAAIIFGTASAVTMLYGTQLLQLQTAASEATRAVSATTSDQTTALKAIVGVQLSIIEQVEKNSTTYATFQTQIQNLTSQLGTARLDVEAKANELSTFRINVDELEQTKTALGTARSTITTMQAKAMIDEKQLLHAESTLKSIAKEVFTPNSYNDLTEATLRAIAPYLSTDETLARQAIGRMIKGSPPSAPELDSVIGMSIASAEAYVKEEGVLWLKCVQDQRTVAAAAIGKPDGVSRVLLMEVIGDKITEATWYDQLAVVWFKDPTAESSFKYEIATLSDGQWGGSSSWSGTDEVGLDLSSALKKLSATYRGKWTTENITIESFRVQDFLNSPIHRNLDENSVLADWRQREDLAKAFDIPEFIRSVIADTGPFSANHEAELSAFLKSCFAAMFDSSYPSPASELPANWGLVAYVLTSDDWELDLSETRQDNEGLRVAIGARFFYAKHLVTIDLKYGESIQVKLLSSTSP